MYPLLKDCLVFVGVSVSSLRHCENVGIWGLILGHIKKISHLYVVQEIGILPSDCHPTFATRKS